MIGAALSPKQAKFVAEYLVDGNGSRAALAAGYGESGRSVAAVRLLGNASVRAAIEARQGVDSQRLGLARQDVIQGLLEAVQMARERQEPAAMISAWRELGRLMGHYAPDRRQVEVTAVADVEIGRLERLSDAELVRLIDGHP
jgi:hypothetical protein